jgi:hypothetical protein
MPPKSYHLVHANIAIGRAPLDHPIMKDFVDLADQIDEIATNSAGFISQPTPPDAGSVFKDPALLNLSVWESVENLRNFTFSGEHSAALERRTEWFTQEQPINYVLYWEVAGHTPLEREVMQRLTHLREHGPTPYAFTFNEPFSVAEALSFSQK